MSDQEWNENWETIYSNQPGAERVAPEKHEGRWEEWESASGQDDTFWIACSCGWRSARIWSRLSVPSVERAFELHKGAVKADAQP